MSGRDRVTVDRVHILQMNSYYSAHAKIGVLSLETDRKTEMKKADGEDGNSRNKCGNTG